MPSLDIWTRSEAVTELLEGMACNNKFIGDAVYDAINTGLEKGLVLYDKEGACNKACCVA